MAVKAKQLVETLLESDELDTKEFALSTSMPSGKLQVIMADGTRMTADLATGSAGIPPDQDEESFEASTVDHFDIDEYRKWIIKIFGRDVGDEDETDIRFIGYWTHEDAYVPASRIERSAYVRSWKRQRARLK